MHMLWWFMDFDKCVCIYHGIKLLRRKGFMDRKITYHEYAIVPLVPLSSRVQIGHQQIVKVHWPPELYLCRDVDPTLTFLVACIQIAWEQDAWRSVVLTLCSEALVRARHYSNSCLWTSLLYLRGEWCIVPQDTSKPARLWRILPCG
jgi:hypothetical protein